MGGSQGKLCNCIKTNIGQDRGVPAERDIAWVYSFEVHSHVVLVLQTQTAGRVHSLFWYSCNDVAGTKKH